MMRKVRLLSLLSVAMIAAALSIAAAPASASTVLCKKAETPCGSTNKYPGGTTITSSLSTGTKTTSTSSLVQFSCSGSTLAAKTGPEAGSPIQTELTTLSFSGCLPTSGPECSASAYGLPTAAGITDSGAGNGALTVNSLNYEFTCKIFGISTNCLYNAPNVSFALTGGSPATLSSGKVTFTKVGGSGTCSTTLSWSGGTYDVSAPNPLFATTGSGAEQTGALCKENVSPCPSASKYLAGDALEASASGVTFTQFGEPWSCNSTLKGKIKVGGGSSINATFPEGTFGSCSILNGSCTAGKMEATSAAFTPSGGGNGTLTLQPLTIVQNCTYWGSSFTCIYWSSKASLSVTGGSPAKAVATNIEMSKQAGSSAICRETLSWSGTYSFSKPSPLYLT